METFLAKNFIIAEDEEEEIFMETKSINLSDVGVRQKLDFLDVSYEDGTASDKEEMAECDVENSGTINKLKANPCNQGSPSEHRSLQDQQGENVNKVHTPVAKLSGMKIY